jgi:hypothetical protein
LPRPKKTTATVRSRLIIPRERATLAVWAEFRWG